MHLNFSLLSNFVVIAFLSALGLYVLFRAGSSKITSSFAFMCISLSLWSFGGYMLKNTVSVAGIEFWGRYIFLGPILLVYCFVYFSFVFPSGDIKKTLNYVLLAIMGTFVVLVPTPFILERGVLTGAGPAPVWGVAYPLFAVYFLTLFVWGAINLFRKIIKAEGSKKIQLRYVSWGLFFTFVFGILFNLVFPSLGVGKYVDIGPIFTLITVAFTAYAITKYRLMDISVIISRALAEVLVVTALGSIYLSLVWLYFTYVSTQIDLLFLVWTIVFGIFIGHYFLTIRLFVQTSSDKLFLRGKYDYYKELSEISTKVGEKMSLKAILEILYRAFRDVVEISNPRIYLPENFTEPEKGATKYVVYNKTCDINESCESLALNDPLVDQLITSRNHIMDPHNPKHELLVPCLLENRLIAIFALGRKLSEDPYTENDIRLLEILANQAAIALDHTRSYERIKMDLETAEKELARSQRLASLGTLTAGVTHEIRNPLTVIRSETERLANKERDLEYLKQFRDLLLKHIDRISGIVQRMLGLAKESVKKQQEVDLNEIIEATLQCFTFDKVKVEKELNIIPKFMGNPDELQEVFVNFIQNAIEAMSNGGTLGFKTYSENNRVVAEISDTGKGIADNIREKIFDPFFSTRHEGAGLGLSIVYRIIREHGGDIKVQSEEGKGTTFKILF